MSENDQYARGVAAFKAGDYDTAVEELEAVTKSDPANHKAFCYLGATYAAKQRYNAAIGAFKSAQQIAPGVASIHYNIAQAYEAGGVYSEAEYEYGRALEINPNYTLAQEALAKLKKRLDHV
ncbi:MAG: tetratricopeptide repeat protein [Armatimonadetes bacterium]|jgi:tetratricopeptide (TPR) repeat protein|nr:tetratricopeptide repeat protein [Armatimonadota bacterium]